MGLLRRLSSRLGRGSCLLRLEYSKGRLGEQQYIPIPVRFTQTRVSYAYLLMQDPFRVCYPCGSTPRREACGRFEVPNKEVGRAGEARKTGGKAARRGRACCRQSICVVLVPVISDLAAYQAESILNQWVNQKGNLINILHLIFAFKIIRRLPSTPSSLATLRGLLRLASEEPPQGPYSTSCIVRCKPCQPSPTAFIRIFFCSRFQSISLCKLSAELQGVSYDNEEEPLKYP